MFCTQSSTKLPSFNELLTSIPLPNDFLHNNKSSISLNSPINNSTTSTTNSITTTPSIINSPSSNDYASSISSNSSSVSISQDYKYKSIQYQPQPIHYIPLQYNTSLSPIINSNVNNANPSYITYKRSNINSSISPKTILDSTNNNANIASTSSTPLSMNSPSNNNKVCQSPINNRSSTPRKLSGNVNGINGSIIRKHICKVCSRSFTTSGHLARHNRIHTGERKHECPWPNCSARFARQDNCMQHYKTHTNGKNKKSKLNFKNSNLRSKNLIL